MGDHNTPCPTCGKVGIEEEAALELHRKFTGGKEPSIFMINFIKAMCSEFSRPAGMTIRQLKEITYPYLASYAINLWGESGWSREKQTVLESVNTELATAIHNKLTEPHPTQAD